MIWDDMGNLKDFVLFVIFVDFFRFRKGALTQGALNAAAPKQQRDQPRREEEEQKPCLLPFAVAPTPAAAAYPLARAWWLCVASACDAQPAPMTCFGETSNKQ